MTNRKDARRLVHERARSVHHRLHAGDPVDLAYIPVYFKIGEGQGEEICRVEYA